MKRVDASHTRWLSRREWLLALLLVAATAFAYLSVWRAGFIWDDDSHLTQNSCVVGPLGFKGIWTTAAATYYPLVLSNFWLQHALWGLAPLPYHLVNVGMHAACAILLWRLLDRLQVKGAWLGAAIWALHPVQVESVAWITELKNTQSCFFYLLSILSFLNWRERAPEGCRKSWFYLAALACAAFAVLSKSSTVMLPVVLGLCWWWLEGRWRWKNIGPLIPFFLISAIASAWTIWEQKYHSGAIGAYWAQTWLERVIVAGCDIWFYAGKLVWPHPLIFIYPRWQLDASRPLMYLPIAIALAGLLFLWWKRNGWMRPLAFASAYFVISLFPVLGFFSVYFFRFSFVGDHFQYLASIGPLALAGAALVTGFEFLGARNSTLLRAFAAMVLLLSLGILTWHQSAMYVDEETLWRTTVSQNPASWLAQNNLGDALLKKGMVDEALVRYRKVIELLPSDPYVHDNLSNALLQKGLIEEAVEHCREAVQLRPNDPEAHYNLATALARQGHLDEAIGHFRKALEIRAQPLFVSSMSFRDQAMAGRHNAEIHYNLASALIHNGDADGAIQNYEEALALRPDYAEAHVNLGNVLLQRNEVDKAISHYEKALRLRPSDADMFNNLGNALLRRGDVDDAIAHYRKALELRPDDADAHSNFGSALMRKGLKDEALAHFDKALQLRANSAGGDNADAHYNLANLLLERGEIESAIVHYQRAIELRGGYPEAHSNLGMAFQLAGRFAEAIGEYEKTLTMAPQSVPTRNNLARLLASCPDPSLRNAGKAVQLAKEAAKLTQDRDALVFRTLANAYAENGQFAEAVATAEQALQLAVGQAPESWIDSVRRELEFYRAHQRSAPK